MFLRPGLRQCLHQPVRMRVLHTRLLALRPGFAQRAPQQRVDEPDLRGAAEHARGFGGGADGGVRG